jgi:DNA-binding response OmpR family regulator
MVAVVSSESGERSTFASSFEQRGLNTVVCPSVRTFRREHSRLPLRVVLVRHQLQDGYSDDILALLAERKNSTLKVVVLLTAGTPSSVEVRQIGLGADCVQRDPIRLDVLLAYIEKYARTPSTPHLSASAKIATFCGATLNILDRSLQFAGQTVLLTPREVMLVELLSGSVDQVVTYEALYEEILGRRFRGDTSNMRVLLAKLDSSARKLGLSLRHSIEVIPKAGYRYHTCPAVSPMVS